MVTAKSCVKPGIPDPNAPEEKPHPLWTFLQNAVKDKDGTPDIKWNFTKFLVNRDGEVVFRS